MGKSISPHKIEIRRRKSFKPLSCLLAAALVISAACKSREDRDNDSVLKAAAKALNESVRQSQDAIPDSVLNAAQCVITIPSLPDSTHADNLSGVASCRQGPDWLPPIIISFSGRLSGQRPTTLILVVLTEKAVMALHSGTLRVAHQNIKPPLVSTKAVVTGFDLTSDYFAYQASPTGALVASDATGQLGVSSLVKTKELERAQDLRKGRDPAAKYQESLESFLNTIIPTGIVIHHTAVLATDKLPTGEKEVDHYHQERGFEIYCSGQVYHVAYHYLILPDGKVQKGRPDHCQGAHARGYNSYIGISVIGDFSSRDNPSGEKGHETPSAEQIKALTELCRSLRHSYNIPLQHILRHSDISSTDCPGDRFPFTEVLRNLQQVGTLTKAPSE